MPGDREGDHLERPGAAQAAHHRAERVRAQPLDERVVGSDPPGGDRAARRRRHGHALLPVERAVEPERARQLAAALELDGEDAQPDGGPPPSATTAVSVDLPTPPLPATNSTVDRRKNATGSTGGGYRAGAGVPAKNPCSEALSTRGAVCTV